MEAHAMVTWLPSTPPPLLPPPRPPPPPEAPDAPAAAPVTAAAAAAASHDSTWAEKKTKFVPTKSSRAAAIPALHLPPELPAAAADGGAASSTPANDAPHGATAPTASTQLSPDGVPPFPFLTLLVSGGHNLLVLTTALGAHAILGSTLDDSIGEAFDKTARLLGIPQIPGGPVLERLAREGDPRRHALPAPLSKTKDAELRASCDFSYAGLKSAVRQLLETRLPPTRRSELPAAELQRELADVAASFQRVAVEHLAQRTARALEWALETAPNLTCLVVAGGVAANLLVRSELARVASEAGLPMVCPPLRLCMDNGLMVAWTGVQRLRLGLAERPLRADADDETQRLFVEVRPKWPLGPRDPRSKTLQQQLSKRKQPHNQPNQPAQTAPAETLEEPLVAEDVGADGQASMTKPNGQASKRPRAEAEVES
jgi:glycoprotease/Kae1 family metallohydrolase